MLAGLTAWTREFFVSCHPWRPPQGPSRSDVKNFSRKFFAGQAGLRHTSALPEPPLVLPHKQSPYDPFPLPPPRLRIVAPPAVPLGTLGNHQPVRLHPQARPQQAGVLRAAAAVGERPGGGRPRVHQGRPAASGVAGGGRGTHRARRLLLPDAGTGLVRPPGQARHLANPGSGGHCPRPACRGRRADRAGQRVLGAVAGPRNQPMETAVRR